MLSNFDRFIIALEHYLAVRGFKREISEDDAADLRRDLEDLFNRAADSGVTHERYMNE